MPTLAHYTLTTGHLRESPRSEVGPGIVEMLAPMLAPGTHRIPGMQGYYATTSIVGSTLRAIVGGPGPLVSMWVCLDVAGLELAVMEAKHGAAVDVALPACLVQILPAMAATTVHWLGDFERCLAWAWIEKSTEEPGGNGTC